MNLCQKEKKSKVKTCQTTGLGVLIVCIHMQSVHLHVQVHIRIKNDKLLGRVYH